LDRDNINDNPTSAKSFAKRSPLGEVVTNDLKRSITKEASDTLLTSMGVGLDVSSVSSSTSSATITFAREHGLSGIVTYSTLTAGATYTDGTYQNVKILNGSQTGTWQGATAKVIVSGGAIVSADIVSSGSGYSSGALYFDSSVVGTGNGAARFNIVTAGISTAIGNVVQFTGAGTTSDGYYRITSVPAKNQIAIAKTAGDPDVITDQYAFVVGPSIRVSSNTAVDSTSGITTFICSSPHGLVAGNRFRIINSTNNNLGDYIVNARVGINTFTAITNKTLSASSGYILKHGLSANSGVSDSSIENLGIRSVPFFDEEHLTVVSFTSTTQIRVSSPISAAGIVKRFPLGSYIQIDEEIMRVVSSTLGGTFNDELTVIRGALATRQESHDNGSLIKKIKPISIEFRRPSIVRASGHTFEYLGYGPGNYSTGLPQIQVTTLTEREEFLVQSQERSGGVVVYTGMNNKGDQFNGNTKTSASSGQIVSYDIPKPTITGEDPNRLSVVFDEVTIKERLVVEGGNSSTVLSQFNGPVTFNKEVKINDTTNVTAQLRVTNTTESTSYVTGALTVTGGVGIERRLNVGGDTKLVGTTESTSKDTGVLVVEGGVGIEKRLNVGGDTIINGTTQSTTKDTGALIVEGGVGIEKNLNVGGTSTFTGLLGVNGGATIDNIRIGIAGDNEIDTSTGNLTIDSAGGTTTIDDILVVSGNTTFQSNVYLGDSDILNLGAGNDLQIYHDGSNSFIDDTGTGALYIRGNGSVNIQKYTGEDMIVATADGAINLYFNNSNKLQTTTTGVAISGELTVTGDITAFYTSDQRLKNNITPIPNALNKVLSISGNTFDWNEKSGKEGTEAGVIAQEVLEVLPEVVTTRDNGYLAVHYDKIVPLLIEAVKELSGKVDELQQKLNDK
jgi:hypothetical protein